MYTIASTLLSVAVSSYIIAEANAAAEGRFVGCRVCWCEKRGASPRRPQNADWSLGEVGR